jgi:hypothetical protein
MDDRDRMGPDAHEEQRIEPLELEVNGNKVLVRQRTHGRGAESGIELDIEIWVIWTLDGARIARGEAISPGSRCGRNRRAARVKRCRR